MCSSICILVHEESRGFSHLKDFTSEGKLDARFSWEGAIHYWQSEFADRPFTQTHRDASIWILDDLTLNIGGAAMACIAQ